MRFARACLLLAWLSVVALALGLAAALLLYVPHLVILYGLVTLWWGRKRFRVTGAYGTASWADHRSMLGMLNAVGIPLGSIPRLSLRKAAWHLWRCRDATAAVRTFLRSLDRRPNFVASKDCVHAVGFAGSGKGKTTALIFPLAFTDPSPIVCLDPKGEIYKTVAAYRMERFKRRQVVLDPWRCCTSKPDRLNVMDLLSEGDPNTLDEARALAEAVVTRKSESHADPHWDDSAEVNITGIIALLITMEGPKSLQTVAQVHLTTQSALLRLWVTCLLRAITKGGLTDKPVRFVLDEAAALGPLPVLENAISQLRSYGLRVFAMYQSMGQLETCFPKGQAQTFLSSMDVRILFGVNDYATAEYVSKSLGDQTVMNQSGSSGSGTSRNLDAFTPDAKQVSTNAGTSWQEGARNLLQPAEVMKLPAQQAVVFVNGKTLMTTLTPHYQREFKRWKWQQGRFYRGWMIARSVMAGLLMAVCVATILVVLYHAVLVPAPQTQGRFR